MRRLHFRRISINFTVEEYKGTAEAIDWQDGFSNGLDGLTIEQQLRCYAWTTYKQLTEVSYKELESKCREKEYFERDIEPVNPEIVLVKDGKVVGVRRKKVYYMEFDGTWPKEYSGILPYERYCYDSSSDNNGAGYKASDWYKYLVCLPANHTLW